MLFRSGKPARIEIKSAASVQSNTPDDVAETALLNLTALVYKELEGIDVPVTQEMLHDYFDSFR